MRISTSRGPRTRLTRYNSSRNGSHSSTVPVRLYQDITVRHRSRQGRGSSQDCTGSGGLRGRTGKSIVVEHDSGFSNACVTVSHSGQGRKGRAAREAMEYVGGWTVGNDISARKLQLDPKLAGPSPQFGFSKGFDTWAPMGPCIVANDLIGDPSALQLTTKINGEVRQDESVRDLLFDCAYCIEYLSQGTTLQKGSVIMTGTPGGMCFYHPSTLASLANSPSSSMKVSEMVLDHPNFWPPETKWRSQSLGSGLFETMCHSHR